MSEEIIKKIEKEGYKDKEKVWNTYNDLKNSLRHIENSIIALITIFITLITLFKTLEIKLELAIILGFLGLYVILKRCFYYSKEEKLLKELINIIAEDPMDKEDIEVLKDTLDWLLLAIGMFIIEMLIIFS
jgi:hypothetical protein